MRSIRTDKWQRRPGQKVFMIVASRCPSDGGREALRVRHLSPYSGLRQRKTILVLPTRETSTMVMTAPSILFDVVREISHKSVISRGHGVNRSCGLPGVYWHGSLPVMVTVFVGPLTADDSCRYASRGMALASRSTAPQNISVSAM